MKALLKATEELYERSLELSVRVASLLLLAMVVYISASVFLRRTGFALGWTLEVTEYTLIVTTFLGAGWALRNGGHIVMDMVPSALRGRSQEIYGAATFGIVALVCLGFTVTGVASALDAYARGTLQVKVYTFPKWILISVVPLGGVFLIVESVRKMVRFIRGKMVLVVDDEPDVAATVRDLLPGYVVEVATDFPTARTKIRRHLYDAVILDIMGVQGLELLKLSVEKAMPTVMLTAHAVNQDALTSSLRDGAVSFLPKEHMSDIGLFIDHAITLDRDEARSQFFMRLMPYFDLQFGDQWRREQDIARQVEKALIGSPKHGIDPKENATWNG